MARGFDGASPRAGLGKSVVGMSLASGARARFGVRRGLRTHWARCAEAPRMERAAEAVRDLFCARDRISPRHSAGGRLRGDFRLLAAGSEARRGIRVLPHGFISAVDLFSGAAGFVAAPLPAGKQPLK